MNEDEAKAGKVAKAIFDTCVLDDDENAVWFKEARATALVAAALSAAREEGRREGLERAAKIALYTYRRDDDESTGAALRAAAADIRAQKETPK